LIERPVLALVRQTTVGIVAGQEDQINNDTPGSGRRFDVIAAS
jgi:hypothetical protein